MTEKKTLREQRANHSYVQLPEVRSMYYERERDMQSGVQSSGQRGAQSGVKRSVRQEPVLEQVRLQRVVTIPQEDPSSAWNSFAQRQEQLRRARSKPQRYVSRKLPAARTYTQTGVRATSGRIKAIRQAQQAEVSPVPTRSGRKQLRKGWLWRILSFFAILAVVLLALNFAFTNNAFRIKQVNVAGTHNRALISAIQGMGMQGKNIFLVDVNGAVAKVDAYPIVASTVITRNWPNQLIVTVTERVPVLLWQTQHGTFGVDALGFVVAPLSETANASHLLTVVDTRATTKSIHPGMQLDQGDTSLALSIFNNLPRVAGITKFNLRYQLTPEGGTYVVQSPDGWIAYLGNAQDTNPLNNRLIELQQILLLAQQQQLTLATVDLRYGLRPVYTLKNG